MKISAAFLFGKKAARGSYGGDRRIVPQKGENAAVAK